MASPAALATPALIAAVLSATTFRVIRRVVRHRAAGRGRRRAGSRPGPPRRPVRLSDQQLSAHGLIVGASGSGKSTTLLRILDRADRARQAGRRDRPEGLADVRRAARRRGRPGRTPVPGLEPRRTRAVESAATWQPHRAEGQVDRDRAVHRAALPAGRRAVRAAGGQGPAEVEPGGQPTMAASSTRWTRAGCDDAEGAACRGRRSSPRIPGRAHPRPAERDPRAGNAAGDYHRVPHGPVPAATGAEAIDLRSALDGGEVVLFSLNSSRYGGLAGQLGTLVIQDIVSAAGDRIEAGKRGTARWRRRHRRVLRDRRRQRRAVVRPRARGRPQRSWSRPRSSPTSTRAGGLRDQMIGNTAIKIVHRQDVPASAQTVAQMAGTDMAWEETSPDRGPPWPGRRRQPRYAPAGRALHRSSKRDQDAPDGRGGRDLEASDRQVSASCPGETARSRPRRPGSLMSLDAR